MNVREVNVFEYFMRFDPPMAAYASVEFAELNAERAERLCYFASDDVPLGIILGLRDGVWHSPFSAPYTEIVGNGSVEQIKDFLKALREQLAAPIEITLAPLFHPERQLHRAVLACQDLAVEQYADVNYHYPLDRFKHYFYYLQGAGRRNLRRALSSDFDFRKTYDIDHVYSIIERHHQAKGYPVRMSLQTVKDTAAIVPTDFFLLRSHHTDVAAAMIQHSYHGTVQLIYWGDLEGFSRLRPMNFMAYAICRYYARGEGAECVADDCDINFFDLGPASIHGVADAGLCRFKESLGALPSEKFSFVL